MNKITQFHVLQIMGGTFPTGGFSQSWGLETYVEAGIVTSSNTLKRFLLFYLKGVVESMEGPAFVRSYDLACAKNNRGLREFDRQLTSMKLTKETREGSLRTGKAAVGLSARIMDDLFIQRYYEENHSYGINSTLAYGLILARLGVEKGQALESFVFALINGFIQSGIKLIPLGNTEGQQLFMDLMEDMVQCVILSLEKSHEDMTNFSPGLDLASMKHESLETRLYMS